MEKDFYTNDIADKLFIMNDATVEKLFNYGTDAFTLYSFYYKTAKWQKTNSPWAKNEYVAEKLGWSLSRVKKAKAILTQNQLIAQERITDKLGRAIKWVIRLNYLQSSTGLDSQPVENSDPKSNIPTGLKVPTLDDGDDIYTNNNKISNNNYNNNKKENKNNKLFLQKKAYGEFENVMLTEDELKKLIKSYGWYLTDAIEKLSSYLAYKGDKYKSHYAVFAKNNWVWKEVHNDPECGGKPKLDYVMDDAVPGGMRLQTPAEYYFKKYNLSE